MPRPVCSSRQSAAPRAELASGLPQRHFALDTLSRLLHPDWQAGIRQAGRQVSASNHPAAKHAAGWGYRTLQNPSFPRL